ncbi:MAG: V-type ATPase subunit subunit G family protein [Oscillospiraceae bacterium]
MAAEMLDKVLAAENDADKKEKQAKLHSDEILKAANDEAKSILIATNEKIEELKQEHSQLISNISQKLISNAENEAKTTALDLKKNANSKLSEAVGIVKAIITD